MESKRHPGVLPHEWTRVVNGIFIWLVFIRHFGILGVYGSNAFFSWEQRYLGQLIVTTFLFFSGYGLMYSIQKASREYIRKLILVRLPKLWGTFATIVLIYAGVKTCMGCEYTLIHVLVSLTGWKSVGNPTWYITMTLVEYLLIWCSFRCLGTKRSWRAVVMTALLTMLVIYVISCYKERLWYNTILCLPAGMIFALVGEDIRRFLMLRKWQIGCICAVLLFTGAWIHREAYDWCKGLPILKIWAGSMVANLGAILFACGVAFAVAKAALLVEITFQNPFVRFMHWCGGPVIIYIFLLHNLPMQLGRQCEWIQSGAVLYFVFCLVMTLLMVIGAVMVERFLRAVRG